jgi:hypothetical protein
VPDKRGKNAMDVWTPQYLGKKNRNASARRGRYQDRSLQSGLEEFKRKMKSQLNKKEYKDTMKKLNLATAEDL